MWNSLLARQLVRKTPSDSARHGAMLVFAAIMLVVVFAFVTFTIDTGYIVVTKNQLQSAADSAALAAVVDIGGGATTVNNTADTMAGLNKAAGKPVSLKSGDVELGLFNLKDRTFSSTNLNPNAVKVTARVKDQPLFFGPVIKNKSFDMSATAIAMLNPRDIVFVVDLSGSMNDDTEPAWATPLIQSKLSSMGASPAVATDMMAAVYTDFGFGTYPGTLQYLGAPLGVQQDGYAYAEMTKDNGPLTCNTLDVWYRILTTDSEQVRREKAYRWIIDNQIKEIMPNAKPTPDSRVNFDYWQRYIDYLMTFMTVGDPPPPPPPKGGGGGGSGGGGGGSGGGGGGGPSPPAGRPLSGKQQAQLDQSSNLVPEALAEDEFPSPGGEHGRPLGPVVNNTDNGVHGVPITCNMSVTFSGGMPRRGKREYITIPPGNRISGIRSWNNPNNSTFPSASSSTVSSYRNKIGYFTYIQFMMDLGREETTTLSDTSKASTPLSVVNKDCPFHTEVTAGGTFSFPPREQPMHAARRSLIAAIQVVKEMNAGVPTNVGDWVSIVTFDSIDSTHAPKVVQPLTADFMAAMTSCTKLQSVWDIGRTTATENGLKLARDHLKPTKDGGSGRSFASKVIVLVTDGVPNVWLSTAADIAKEQGANPSADYYDPAYLWYNGPLMQTSLFQRLDHGKLFPVGMGMGADLNFMDRLARMSVTDDGGQSPRGAENPALYEQELTKIFKKIIQTPGSRLVK